MKAAGINLKHAFLRRPRKLNREQVLEQLRQRYASGLSLVWSDVCMDNRVFAVAAKNVFGSWRKTLIAAGIDPSLHRNLSNKAWERTTGRRVAPQTP